MFDFGCTFPIVLCLQYFQKIWESFSLCVGHQDVLRQELCGFFTLMKLYFQFLSYWMGYDHGDSFPFDFEWNRILFGSKSEIKLSQRSYPIRFERKLNTSFLSVVIPVWFLYPKHVPHQHKFPPKMTRSKCMMLSS